MRQDQDLIFLGKKHRLGIFLKEEKQRNKDNSISRVLSVTNHSGFIFT